MTVSGWSRTTLVKAGGRPAASRSSFLVSAAISLSPTLTHMEFLCPSVIYCNILCNILDTEPLVIIIKAGLGVGHNRGVPDLKL